MSPTNVHGQGTSRRLRRGVERVVVGVFVVAVGVDAVLAVRWDDPPGTDDRTTGVAAVADVRGLRPGTTASTIEQDGEVDGAIPVPGDEVPADGAVTTVAPSAPASTPTTVAGSEGPTIRPGSLRAPSPGSYPLRFVSDGQASEGALVVDGEGWQRRTFGSEVRSTQQLSWGDTGAILAASGEPGTDGACRWEGPAVAVPSDLRDGRSWSSRTTCRAEVGGKPVRVVRREQARLSKRARTQLGGRSLDTWVIDREIALTIEAETFTTTSVSISTELFAPELGLAVYQTSRTDVPMPDGTIRSVYASEELLGLP